MNISKRFALTATILLVSNEDLFASESLISGVSRTSIRRSLSSRLAQSVVSGHFGQYVFATREYSNKKSLYNKALVPEGSSRRDLVEVHKLQHHNQKILELEELQSKLQTTNNLLNEIKKRLEIASDDIQKNHINSHARINGFSSNNRFSSLLTKEVPIQLQRKPFIHSTPRLQDYDLESSAGAKSNIRMTRQESQLDSESSGIKKENPKHYQRSLRNVDNVKSDYINRVIAAAKAPHKLNKEKLTLLLDLYSALPQRSIEGVSRVLSGQTNTYKSMIYNEVNAHVRAKGADLATYRNMYARLNHSKYTDVMQIIYDMMDSKQNTEIDQPQTMREIKPSTDPSDIDVLGVRSRDLLTNHDYKPESGLVNKKNAIRSTASSVFSSESTQQREERRFYRIYGLLPEWHGKSVTGILSGATRNKQLPIWGAVKKAIAKIQREALAAGDKTIIDLDYFRKLHWSSVRVRGTGGGRSISSLNLVLYPNPKNKISVA